MKAPGAPAEPHYQLVCYVGRAGTVPAPFEGWATFEQIYLKSADGCRYAVGKTTDGDYLVWDLDDAEDRLTRFEVIPAPPPKWTGGPKDLDGLIMKAVALYGR